MRKTIVASEKNFENRIKAFLKSKNIYFFKMLGCAATKAGVPDLICCVNGHFVAIEVKGEGGRASPLQLLNIKEINDCGGKAVLVYPNEFDKLKGFIEALLNECD